MAIQQNLISRRKFLGQTGMALTAFQLVPRHVVAGSGKISPNEKLNIACIGTGGRGGANLNGVSRENIVALCDVDPSRGGWAFEKFPQAKTYRDFRKMLEEMDEAIDAVTVSTPDHTHAVAAMMAIKQKKHVYCEKPLAHSVHEVRALMEAARKYGVMTQLGNQGHSSDSIRAFCEGIWDGAIGNVHTIHARCGSRYCHIDQLPSLKENHPVPDTLDYDLWLGPAPFRPYHPAYLPGKWRGWTAFGGGVIGDWVCHVVDPSFWALDLGSPTTILAEAKDYDPQKHGETYPCGSKITFEFPAKGKRGRVKLVWFDGNEELPRPDDFDPEAKVPNTGAIIYGDNGGMSHGSHGAGGARLFPETKMKAYAQPAKTIPRVKGHHEDWLEAIRTGKPAGSNFDYGGPLTEIALLGIVATRMLGQKLEWDTAKMRFTNNAEANQFLTAPYRRNWKL